jgi:hypothetical protein
MPTTFSDLPPDHPIFTLGPSFVLKDEPDEDEKSSAGPPADDSPQPDGDEV